MAVIGFPRTINEKAARVVAGVVAGPRPVRPGPARRGGRGLGGARRGVCCWARRGALGRWGGRGAAGPGRGEPPKLRRGAVPSGGGGGGGGRGNPPFPPLATSPGERAGYRPER